MVCLSIAMLMARRTSMSSVGPLTVFMRNMRQEPAFGVAMIVTPSAPCRSATFGSMIRAISISPAATAAARTLASGTSRKINVSSGVGPLTPNAAGAEA